MQSKSRRNKRIMSGRQNPMPRSQKMAKCSLNNPGVFRRKKFVVPVKDTAVAVEYNPQDHLY